MRNFKAQRLNNFSKDVQCIGSGAQNKIHVFFLKVAFLSFYSLKEYK